MITTASPAHRERASAHLLAEQDVDASVAVEAAGQALQRQALGIVDQTLAAWIELELDSLLLEPASRSAPGQWGIGRSYQSLGVVSRTRTQ